MWVVFGSGNGLYELYIEIIEVVVICRKFCYGRDEGFFCLGIMGCIEGIERI